jgi:DNA invertase Pin-like site-specific DNA recombinase
VQLDGYIRVSRVNGREGERFASPSEQRAAINRWATARGHRVDAWHEDLDESGGTADRPGLQAALARIERGDTDGLVGAYWSRTHRSVAVGLEVRERVQAAGGLFVGADAELASEDSAIGNLTFIQLSAINQYQRDLARETWQAARRRAVERGVSIGRAPFGYDRDEGGRLHPNADEPLVRELFRMRGEGTSWLELARWLDKVRPRDGDGRWTRQSVRAIIENPTYLGQVRHGEFINDRAHTPLVKQVDFDRAQVVGGVRTPRGSYLLSGIARCAGCGHCLRASKGGARGPRVYKCSKRFSSGVCPAPATIVVDALEAHVEELFLREARVEVEGGSDSSAVTTAREAVAAAETELDSWQRDTEAQEAFGRDAWLRGATERRVTLERAQAAYAAELRTSPVLDIPEAAGRWDDLTLEERREVLRACIDAVMVRRLVSRGPKVPPSARTLVLWRGEAPTDLPSTGRAGIRPFTWADDAPDTAVAAT